MVAESKHFLELDFSVVKEILSSSQLKITSEIEVFRSADKWIRYDFVSRNKHAKKLLLKVRLHLLSDRALDYVLHEPSAFRYNIECIYMIQNILRNKKSYRSKFRSVLVTRLCNQRMLNVVAYDFSNLSSLKIFECDISNKEFKKLKDFNNLSNDYVSFKACFHKGSIYVCVCQHDVLTTLILKYCLKNNNSWGVVNFCDGLILLELSFCVLLDKIYLIGGHARSIDFQGETYVCIEFNTVNNYLRYAR